MITDKLENIDKYKYFLKPEILDFIKNINKNTETKKYIINNTDYANVETYVTKTHDICFYEMHKKYADIQILLSGEERIDFTDGKKLQTRIPYKDDIEFFENTTSRLSSVYLDGTNFAIIFPNEAHKPQMQSGEQLQVKKTVVKFIP